MLTRCGSSRGRNEMGGTKTKTKREHLPQRKYAYNTSPKDRYKAKYVIGTECIETCAGLERMFKNGGLYNNYTQSCELFSLRTMRSANTRSPNAGRASRPSG